MHPDVEKILKEPLLWAGVIALCIPILASGQLSKLRGFLSFDHGGPVTQPVAIAESPGPGATVTSPITTHPLRTGLQAKDLIATRDGSRPRKIDLASDVPPIRTSNPSRGVASVNDGSINDSPMNDGSRSRSQEPRLTHLPPVDARPELTQPEPEVAISPLPKPADSADPGSLVDAAKLLGYESTHEPKLIEPEFSEPEYREPEITNTEDDEDLVLSFADQPAETTITFKPTPDSSISEPRENSYEQLAEAQHKLDFIAPSSSQQEISRANESQSESAALPETISSSTIELPAMESHSMEFQSMEPSQVGLRRSPVRSSYGMPSSLPPTPMRFQAALRRPSGNSYSQQRHFETEGGGFQTQPQSYRQPYEHQIPQVFNPQSQGRGNATGMWGQ